MSEYQLKLRATDDGNPPLSTTLEITIKLLDINDNDPTFKTSNYYTTIREDIEIGTVIFPDLKSMVVDQDAGENGTFYFKMDQLDNENNPVPSANQLFELRSNENGDWEIVLGANGEQIDRDRGNSPANYSLKVTGKSYFFLYRFDVLETQFIRILLVELGEQRPLDFTKALNDFGHL